jgi:hypothetical protein
MKLSDKINVKEFIDSIRVEDDTPILDLVHDTRQTYKQMIQQVLKGKTEVTYGELLELAAPHAHIVKRNLNPDKTICKRCEHPLRMHEKGSCLAYWVHYSVVEIIEGERIDIVKRCPCGPDIIDEINDKNTDAVRYTMNRPELYVPGSWSVAFATVNNK